MLMSIDHLLTMELLWLVAVADIGYSTMIGISAHSRLVPASFFFLPLKRDSLTMRILRYSTRQPFFLAPTGKRISPSCH